MTSHSKPGKGREKILLTLLPFWAPLIPPVGIANLKSFLQERNFTVATFDGNAAEEFRDFSAVYFDLLKEVVPAEKWGNFYVVGKDVLQNHMMAYLEDDEKKDAEKYNHAIRILVQKTFFCEIDDTVVRRLNRVLADFYTRLERWFTALLEREKPALVGFSVFESTLPASLFAARLTKAKNPDINVIMGGGVFSEQLALGSPNLDFFLEKAPYVDKIFIGEGEKLFLDYLEDRLPAEQRVYTLADIGSKTLDLSTVALPDYSDFDIGQYPFVAAYTSRSCPFQCSFCSETVFYGKYRKKSAPQIVSEMTGLYEKYGQQLFLMCDSLLNPVVHDLSREFINSGKIMYWDGYLRADKHVCDIENTLLWRRGGFYKAKLGLESASPRVLELMNKKITPNQIQQAVSSLARAGIKTSTCWIIGHPGETEEDFQLTLDMVETLKDDIYEVWACPFYYYPSAQAGMNGWEEKTYLLYPAWMKEMLIIQTWYPECEPSREEVYRRMYRFVEHCESLGIPNPFTMYDLYRADRRWEKLQKNAVPSIMEFEKGAGYIDDTGGVIKLVEARSQLQEEGDFDF
ncbi:MAG: B12-binding domain-containing radical SAM protein [Candidatus Aminicenantes bacterium]|nr:B12-binding domain-containing radical SAM protein [Candidatus Aminicenantes bacterium]